MPEGESNKDSREYLREVIRSNGMLGEFWARERLLCVQVKHPTYGNVRFLIDPEAFGGRGCVFDAVAPRHKGDPFGWRRIGFSEFVRMLMPGLSHRLSLIHRRAASELRTFVGMSEAPQVRAVTPAHLAIAGDAEAAAESVLVRLRRHIDGLMVDGQKSLAGSLKQRGETSDPTFPSDLLSLYDLVGEALALISLFGQFLSGQRRLEAEQLLSATRDQVAGLCESLDKHAFDMTMLNFLMGHLDSYIVGLSRMTSKAKLVPFLTESATVAFLQELYYSVLETRTMAENIFSAAVYMEHPADLERWIAEFRCHDYALRELMDTVYAANPKISATTSDLEVFRRDRFMYPPEVAWWMWHALEKETGLPLPRALAFDPEHAAKKLGLRPAPSDEVLTNLKPKALIGRLVEIVLVHSPFDAIVGAKLAPLEVTGVTESELGEAGYLIASPSKPITLRFNPETTLSVKKVRFGSSLPRSPPQAVADDAFRALMKVNPYKRIIVDVSIATSDDGSPGSSDELSFLGYGMLGLIEPGAPSVFEIQRYRLVEKMLTELEAASKAWDVDYRR